MDGGGNFCLFFKSMKYAVPDHFLEVVKSPEVFQCLLHNRIYNVKSDIKDAAFISFINYACYGNIPYIDHYSIEDYKKINVEFGMMKDLIDIAVKGIRPIPEGPIFNPEVRYGFSKNLLLTKDHKITKEFLDAYNNELHMSFEEKNLPIPIRVGEFVYNLDDINHTAFIVDCLCISDDILVPTSFKLNGQTFYVSKIMGYSFRNVTNGKKIKFGNDSHITTIEKNAFVDSSIEKIFLPQSITTLEVGWCYGAYKLKDVFAAPGSNYFSNYQWNCKNFLLYKSDQKSNFDTIVFAPRSVEVFNVPPCIKKITPFAFFNCNNLSEVMPSKGAELNTIDEYGFAGSSVKSLIVPQSVIKIEDCSFFNCHTLESVLFEDGSIAERIGKFAFYNCKFNYINIPESVEELDDGAFCECINLTSIDNNDYSSIKSFGSFVLYNTKVNTLSLGNNFQLYKPLWLFGANNLQNIKVISNNMLFRTVADCLYEETTNKELKLIFAARNQKNIFIPSIVNEIGPFAFYNCKDVENIILPCTVEKIGHSAFMNCNFPEIELPKRIKEIDDYAFSSNNNLKNVKFASNAKGRIVENVLIPNSVKNVGKNIFSFCPKLQKNDK